MSKNNYQAAAILLVEDDDVDAMCVQRALRKLKIANPLVRAKDGIEALGILHNKEIDRPYIILLDLNLPRMGGLEFLTTMRNDERISNNVVFILTTSKDEDDKYAAYTQHVAGYIVKERLDTGFDSLVNLLDHYWRIVELPMR